MNPNPGSLRIVDSGGQQQPAPERRLLRLLGNPNRGGGGGGLRVQSTQGAQQAREGQQGSSPPPPQNGGSMTVRVNPQAVRTFQRWAAQGYQSTPHDPRRGYMQPLPEGYRRQEPAPRELPPETWEAQIPSWGWSTPDAFATPPVFDEEPTPPPQEQVQDPESETMREAKKRQKAIGKSSPERLYRVWSRERLEAEYQLLKKQAEIIGAECDILAQKTRPALRKKIEEAITVYRSAAVQCSKLKESNPERYAECVKAAQRVYKLATGLEHSEKVERLARVRRSEFAKCRLRYEEAITLAAIALKVLDERFPLSCPRCPPGSQCKPCMHRDKPEKKGKGVTKGADSGKKTLGLSNKALLGSALIALLVGGGTVAAAMK